MFNLSHNCEFFRLLSSPCRKLTLATLSCPSLVSCPGNFHPTAPGIDRAFQAILDGLRLSVQTIDTGGRLPITGKVEENIFGDALHALFAAEFINPQHPERLIAIKRILAAYNLDGSKERRTSR